MSTEQRWLSSSLGFKSKKSDQSSPLPNPQNITSKASQQHIKENSNGGHFEEAHTLATYHRSTSSSARIKTPGFFFFSFSLHIYINTHTKKSLIIHNAGLLSASTYSPFRFESVYGEKNALERGRKKYITLFCLLLFASLWFQAAMPHSRSLL